MATPIVSGAAAMTLSLLGASDGKYFKAAQVQAWAFGYNLEQGHKNTSNDLIIQ